MKTIITIQHTQAVHHTNGMVGSWTDWELTELLNKIYKPNYSFLRLTSSQQD